MNLKVVCQKNEAGEKNAPGPFIYCRGKTPGTNRLRRITNFLLFRTRRFVCVKLSLHRHLLSKPIWQFKSRNIPTTPVQHLIPDSGDCGTAFHTRQADYLLLEMSLSSIGVIGLVGQYVNVGAFVLEKLL